MLGVTKLLRLSTSWITGFLISGVLLTVRWGSEGEPKLSTKSHGPLIADIMVDVGTMEDMVGMGAT